MRLQCYVREIVSVSIKQNSTTMYNSFGLVVPQLWCFCILQVAVSIRRYQYTLRPKMQVSMSSMIKKNAVLKLPSLLLSSGKMLTIHHEKKQLQTEHDKIKAKQLYKRPKVFYEPCKLQHAYTIVISIDKWFNTRKKKWQGRRERMGGGWKARGFLEHHFSLKKKIGYT